MAITDLGKLEKGWVGDDILSLFLTLPKSFRISHLSDLFKNLFTFLLCAAFSGILFFSCHKYNRFMFGAN